MNLRKIALYGLAGIGGAYILMLTFVSFVSSNVVTPLRSAISPDQQRVAELVIEQSDEPPSKLVKLWIHRSDVPRRKIGVELSGASTTDIDLTWRTERQLEVVYPISLEILNDPARLDDVEILYSARLPSNPAVKRDAPQAARPLP